CEFHLDEPWDSPHNLTLLPRMPGTYAPPLGKVSKVPPHHTVCRVFHGPGAAFEGRGGLRLPDFLDRTFHNLLGSRPGSRVRGPSRKACPTRPIGLCRNCPRSSGTGSGPLSPTGPSALFPGTPPRPPCVPSSHGTATSCSSAEKRATASPRPRREEVQGTETRP